MNIEELKEQKKDLISSSNPEWQNIQALQLEVQRDFSDIQSLSISTYTKVLDWKLGRQKSRAEKIRKSSPDSLIHNITHCYCILDHPHADMKTRIKMHILLSIPWIGIGLSSAIMALHEPEFYGAINFRTWSVLFDQDKTTFSMNDYTRYLRSIRELADKVGCDVQVIDYILSKQYED